MTTIMDATATRQKLGQLTSSVGAGVLGAGIGVMTASSLRGFEPYVIGVGLALHLWGMVDSHRAEQQLQPPAWATATYWICWLGLVALVIWVVARSW